MLSIKSVLLMGLSISLWACAPPNDVAEWTEELRLHNGESITVWRRAVAKSGGLPEPRGANLEFELRYEPLGISWKRGALQPLLGFDIVYGSPFLVTYILDRNTCASMRKTDFRAEYFKWQSNAWVKVSQDEAPIDQIRRNLWEDYWGRESKDDAKGFVPWERKIGSLKLHPESVKDWLSSHNRYCANFQ